MQSLRKTFLACSLAALSCAFGAQAQTFSDASSRVGQDLKTALSELSDTRETIATEKIPLIREVSKLEDDVRQKTAELDRLRRLRDNSDLGLNRLREQVEATKTQNEYAAGLLDEFVRTFETRIDYSETQLYSATTEEARLALDDSDMSQADRFNKQIDVIGVAIERLGKLSGGYTFDGKALAPNGEIEDGTFAAFGPTVYFASKQSELAGITFNKLNAAEAAIAIPGELFATGIRSFIETGEGSIPADATLGKALKIVEGNDSIMEHLEKGGSVGVVIVGLGIICLLLGIFKTYEVTSFKTPSPEQVQKVLTHIEAHDIANARTSAAAIPGAVGELLQTGVTHADDKRGTLEEILYERILAVRPKLERFLPFIALTAAAAPLLGLLGTVTGMIKTFNLITIFGTGDAKSLSSGISEALVTTELGLVVAIPALILHGLISRMARQKLGDMEQIAVGFINGVIGARNKDKIEDEL
ncbi:MAG: MotA/TolQ/ExbB proton channel family protein [Opitutales bacterium]|jgi:biopolymer transport protein ExbB|nr:MotA/TolQ/ExbB proton channel family protein [Opitutales bacterium]MDP4644659.1 MotA/TolQ/ExbB proton channel family protein [Opitutales bacterium]MDP4694326.1 MotA/TolQ/ExbB proton channel family protein [Opitutales bacterium]MDP4777508.1 MotA/TolQ/ExbB proton channel family protein [Opitutales bacterium]MDP4880187.1 MotA/TolQ/ExbB proton channel family protein [Opitutales bacterium]